MASRRQRDPSFDRKPSVGGKKSVAAPSSFKHFAVILVMYVCKKILLVDPYWKVGVYVCGVTAGSLFTDLVPLPRTYLADKRNFFNVFMVKLGWGWTVLFLGAFVGLTSYTYCCGSKKMMRRHMIRLGVGTIWWFICTNIFQYIENVTGFCGSNSAEHYTKSLCKAAEFEWIGFDISGHAFLMVHCLLTISEEVRCINGWEKIMEVIKTEEEHRTSRMTEEEFAKLKILYRTLTPYIRGLIFALALLMMLWELMLLSTVMYFHNMPQKLLGTLFATAGWFIGYQRLYKIPHRFSPRLPGQGMFKYMKE